MQLAQGLSRGVPAGRLERVSGTGSLSSEADFCLLIRAEARVPLESDALEDRAVQAFSRFFFCAGVA